LFVGERGEFGVPPANLSKGEAFFLNSSGDRFCQIVQISIDIIGLDLLSISDNFLKCGDQPVIKIHIESVSSQG
jgi:hypothetical protein